MQAGSHADWFPCRLVPMQTGSHAGWFPCRLVPMQTGSHADWFPCRLVLMQTGSHAGWFPCRLVPMQTGSHADWFSCRLVLMQAGSHADWFPCRLVPMQTGSHADWFPCRLVRSIAWSHDAEPLINCIKIGSVRRFQLVKIRVYKTNNIQTNIHSNIETHKQTLLSEFGVSQKSINQTLTVSSHVVYFLIAIIKFTEASKFPQILFYFF
uniref:Uncharacterized protein n=1 Tax=Xiphophorus couchianus TaxID=32473 RepID=A0A3B5KUT4_9TELE